MDSERALSEQYLHSAQQFPLFPLNHLLQRMVTWLCTMTFILKSFKADFQVLRKLFNAEHTRN